MSLFQDVPETFFCRVIDQKNGRWSQWRFISDLLLLQQDRYKRLEMMSGAFPSQGWQRVVMLRPFGFDPQLVSGGAAHSRKIYQIAGLPVHLVGHMMVGEAEGVLNGLTYADLNAVKWQQDGPILKGEISSLAGVRGAAFSGGRLGRDPAQFIKNRFPPSRIPAVDMVTFYRYGVVPSHMGPAVSTEWQRARDDGSFDLDPYHSATNLRVVCVPRAEMRLMGERLRLDFMQSLSSGYLDRIWRDGQAQRYFTPFGVACAAIPAMFKDEAEAVEMFSCPEEAYRRFKDFIPARDVDHEMPRLGGYGAAGCSCREGATDFVSGTGAGRSERFFDASSGERAADSSPHYRTGSWGAYHASLTKPVSMRRDPHSVLAFLGHRRADRVSGDSVDGPEGVEVSRSVSAGSPCPK